MSKFNDPPMHQCSGFSGNAFINGILPDEMNLGDLPIIFYKPECGTVIVIRLGMEEVTLTGEQVKEFWRQIERLARD